MSRYSNRRSSGRGIISASSFLVRQFFLPNPFVNLFGNYSDIANIICGGVFVPLSYYLTSCWYVSEKGSEWVGSIGFLINYILLTFLLIGISLIVTNIYWIAFTFFVSYILLCIIEAKLFKRKDIVLK